MEELNKVVRAIGSFILTCIVFACPIGVTLFICTKRGEILFGFVGFGLFIVSIIEFTFVLYCIYTNSKEE